MIKIVVDARTMGSQPSGIGFYLYDFLKGLINIEEFQIKLITDIAESEQILNLQKHIPVICFGKRIYRSACVYSYFQFIKSYLIEEQPNIFWEPNNLIPIKLNGFTGNIVLTVHDLFPITNPEYFSPLYRIYFQRGVKKSIGYADALLFDSADTRRFVFHYFPDAKNKKTFISYLIIDSKINAKIHDDGYFLYIGNVEKRKGSDLLIKAYNRYCSMGGTMPLYLGGRIREKELQTLIDEMAANNPLFHHLGYLSQAEKEEWIAGCTCFLFPSKAEGFGLPPLEAMKYGKRVITSNLPIFEEILCGVTECFEINGSEEEQIECLSKLMASFPKTSESIRTSLYANVLKKYDPQILSESLKKFMLKVEEDSENSI